MGIGRSQNDDVEVEDGDNDQKAFGGEGNGNREWCSICLEVVITDKGANRSWATLQCGHQFHLDCIGSAFNSKGVMQCPNCRNVEKGQWLYATGSRSLPGLSMDDWPFEGDLYDTGYPQMLFGFHWCPFGSLARLHPSTEDREFSSNSYHEHLGQHAIFAEQTGAVSPASHPCPYVAHFGPIHHPSSSNSNGSVSDGRGFNGHWRGPSPPSDISSSYPAPVVDHHYHRWERHSRPFTTTSRTSSIEQPPVPSTTRRSARSSSDHQRPGSSIHPFPVGHSARASSSVASSVSPHYQGSNARTRDRVQALQAYYQQQQPASTLTFRTSSGNSALSQVGAMASSSDQSGFYSIPSVTPGRSVQDTDNPIPARVRARERDHLPSSALSQTGRDAGWGGTPSS